jgi:Cd2+/Zn2+-exporting ATPase/Cu+-exporting ATPase
VSKALAAETDHEVSLDRHDLLRIGLVALLAGATWLQVWRPLARFDLLALAGVIIGGLPIYEEALSALLARRMTMELSMTIAIGAAAAIGELFTALVIVLFVLVAEALEGLTVGRGHRAIQELAELLPRDALVRREGVEERIESRLIRLADIVVLSPGTRIPVDGVVTAGQSFADESTITGEPMPVEKVPGAQVFAGTINQSGALEVRATSVGRETIFGRIIEAVEQAERSRAPVQRLADRLAGYLVYFALGCACLTFLITRDIRATISVVIVAGACGIAAGTPLAILGGIGRAARAGAIVKGGLHLETLGLVDTIVFDKTGTITVGKPEVVEVRPAGGVEERDVLHAASIAEKRSEHPLAKAVLKRTEADEIETPAPDRFEYVPGRGIACLYRSEAILAGSRAFFEERGLCLDAVIGRPATHSEVLVTRGSRFLGSILVADRVRDDAAATAACLRTMGLRTILLTGDPSEQAKHVGEQVPFDEIDAGLLPAQKQMRIRALRGEGRTVVMVGDGVNDAPALAEASVGIAMGSGTDVAMESADVVLLGNSLMTLVRTLEIARACRRVIFQNFAGTLIVDGVGILLAAVGLLNPMFAAFVHVSSELVFIVNSARLLPASVPAAVPGRTASANVVARETAVMARYDTDRAPTS